MSVFGGAEGLGKLLRDLRRGAGEVVDGVIPHQMSAADLFREAVGSEVIEAGQVLIRGMRDTTGYGEPEVGERFGQGWRGFNKATETLSSAMADDWEGAGADAYATANRRQAGRTNTVALLDRSVQTVLAREAYQVTYHRDKMDDQSNYLADLSWVTFALEFAGPSGRVIKYAVELAAVQAALSICSVELNDLSRETGENAAQLRQAVQLYTEAADGAQSTDDTDLFTPPPRTGDDPARRPSDRAERAPTDVTGPGGSAAPPRSNLGARGTVSGYSAGIGAAPSSFAPPLSAPSAAAPPASPFTPSPTSDPALGLLASMLAPLGALLAGGLSQPAAPAATGQSATPQTAAPNTDDDRRDDEGRRAMEPGRDSESDEPKPEAGVDEDVVAGGPVPVEGNRDAERPSVPPAATRPQD
jgi:EspA/EspE family